jgi:hypothetical protein
LVAEVGEVDIGAQASVVGQIPAVAEESVRGRVASLDGFLPFATEQKKER